MQIRCLALMSFLVALGAMPAGQPRAVSSDRGGDIALELPLDSARFERVLWRIAQNTDTQLGVELMPQSALQPHEVRRNQRVEQRVSLVGKAPVDAIAMVIGAAPGYGWHKAGDIVNVQPISASGSFLDSPIPRFAAANVTVLDALTLYRRLFDVSAPAAKGALTSTLSAPGEDTSTRDRVFAENMGRHFSVNVQSVAARDVLNAICVGHGALSWRVDYNGAPMDYAHARVAFVTADGSRIHW